MTLLTLLGAALGFMSVVVLFFIPTNRVKGFALAIATLSASIFGAQGAGALWQAGYAGAALLLMIALVRSPGERPVGNPMFAASSVWWIYFAFAGALAAQTFSLAFAISFVPVLLIHVFVAARLSRDEVIFFIKALLFIAVAEIAVAIPEYASSSLPLWGYQGDFLRVNPILGGNTSRVQGTFGHPIVMGLFLAICFCLTWVNPMKLRIRARLPMLVILAAGLVLTGTRSAILAAFIGVVIHLVLRPAVAGWLRNMAFIGVGAGILVNVDTGLSRLTSDLINSGSWVQRLGSIQGVPNLLARPLEDSLFGSGFFNEKILFARGYLKSNFGLVVVDNWWVYVLGTMGVVGIILFGGLWIIHFVRSDRAGRAISMVFFTMFFSFDILTWVSGSTILFVVISLPNLGDHVVPSAPRTANPTVPRPYSRQRSESSVITSTKSHRHPAHVRAAASHRRDPD